MDCAAHDPLVIHVGDVVEWELFYTTVGAFLARDALPGDISIRLDRPLSLVIGDQISISLGLEVATVEAASGTVVTLTAPITRAHSADTRSYTGKLADPTTPVAKASDPTGGVITIPGPIDRIGPGHYRAQLIPTVPGRWSFGGSASGQSSVSSAVTINVLPAPFAS